MGEAKRRARPRSVRAHTLRSAAAAALVLAALVYLCVRVPRVPPGAAPEARGAPALPPRVARVHRLVRANATVAPEGTGAWARPLVYAALATRDGGAGAPAGGVLLWLFTHGVVLKGVGRELKVRGCRVGRSVFERWVGYSGVVACRLPAPLEDGERLTVVLELDEQLQRVLDGEDAVKGVGEAGEVRLGDIVKMPKSVKGHGRLRKVPMSSLKAVRSDVVWDASKMDGGLLDSAEEPRYELCIMTQEKVFPELIPDWIDYHRRMGVDMFYIYDNHAPEDLADVYKNRDDVEVVYWPWAKAQVEAFNHFLILAKRRCEWAMLIDIDEYIMVGSGGDTDNVADQPLKRHLAQRREQGYSQVYFPEIPMGSSGHQYRPQTKLPEAYVHWHKPDKAPGKTAVWTDDVKPDSRIHRVTLQNGKPYEPEEQIDLQSTAPSNDAFLVHFKYRSWEDWVRKAKGGRAPITQVDWSFKDTVTVEEPSDSFLNMSLQEPYTRFRDYWRRVVALPTIEPQRLVRLIDGKRCSSVHIGKEEAIFSQLFLSQQECEATIRTRTA